MREQDRGHAGDDARAVAAHGGESERSHQATITVVPVSSRSVARLNSDQLRRRDQFESVIRLAEPVLNVILGAGDRLSRVVEPEDNDYYPPRSPNLAPPTPPKGEVTDGS